jgi:hypothetical protein
MVSQSPAPGLKAAVGDVRTYALIPEEAPAM